METSQKLEQILNNPKPLSVTQKNAVLSDKDHIRIIAGAGAGKTETLTRRIVYNLIHEEVDPSAIVAFTFTEKAAQSMKSRVYDRLRGFDRDDIRYRIGDLYIGTIHGYCSRILTDYFGYGSHEVFDANQEMAFLLRIGWELGLGNDGHYSNNCKSFLESVNVVNGELLDEAILEKKEPIFYKRLRKYEDILDSYKRLTFDRMVKLAVMNLQEKSDKLKHVKYLLVDEYQDINRAQEKLIQLIGTNAGIFIVGDPRQTIYKWRGSDEKCFEEFARNYKDTETISITENRRSAKSILNLANTFSDSFESYKYDHIAPTRKDEGIVSHVTTDTENDEARWIADQIERYVSRGICSYSDIGILMRSVTTSAPPFIDEFRERDIPFIVGGKVGLFRREEAKAVGMLFSWLFEGGWWQNDPWNTKDRFEWDDLLPMGIESWQSVVPYTLPDDVANQIIKWKTLTLSGKFEHFTEVYQELLRTLGYLNLDPDDPNQAVIMANLGRFNSLLTDYETAIRIGGKKKRNWQQDMKGLFWYIQNYATSAYEEQQGDDVRAINAVQLVTMHQAKGLEWPVVFMPGLTATRFPSRKAGKPKTWHISRNLFDAAKYDGGIEDERRLFYVAATRAKDVLVLSSFKRINKAVKESGFVSDLPKDLLKELKSNDSLPDYSITKGADIEDIQTFSAGEIINYKTCPHSYRLRQMWGYQPGLNDYLGYGNTLHFCLRNAAELIKNQGYSPISAIATAVDEHFFMPFADEARSKKVKQAARRKLMEFVQNREEDMRRIKEVETRIEFPLQRATIAGKVDVILHEGNAIEIRDYKTSDQVTTFEDSAMQVQVYALGLNMIGESVAKGSIAYLDDASLRDVEVKQSKIEDAQRNAEMHIDGILNRDFKACAGKHCKKCDYGLICKWRGN
jgi:DNA helicase-2/ATP-dependent DNA helicase PcrA